MTHRPLASLPSLSAAHAPSPRPTLSLSALLALCLIVTASTPTLASPSPPAPVAPITQPQVAKVASGLNTRSNTIARAAQGKPPGIASVDWQAVGDSITLVGNFTRLSLAADGPPLDFSVPENHVLMLSQTASQTPSNSSRVRVIGTYPTTSIVAEACLLTDPVAGGSTKLVLGGRLTAVSGTPVSNVFAFNVDTGLIDPLAGGLSGPVSALACINSPSLPPSLWVSSAAGSNAPVAGFAAGRLGEFGGNVALWAGDGWVPLPGKGLGGPVTDIKSDSQGTVYFAGAFRETADGSWSVPPSSQMTSLFVGNVIAPGRLALVALACPNNRNNGWFTDTPTSVLDIQLGTPITLSAIALQNLVDSDDGVKTFRVSSPAVAPGKHYTLIQTNAAGQPVATCVECTLPKDEDIHMYYVATPELTPQTNDILVEVLDSYRVTGTGLASVQIFQREIVVYANAGFNPPFGCSGSAVLSRSLLVGPAWSILSPTAPTVVFATSSRATLDTSYAAFYPSIPTAGLYRVTAHIPPCVANSTAITACTGRGVLTFYVYASTTGGVVPRPATALGTVRIDSRSATPLIAQLGSFNLTSTAVVVLSGVSNGNHVFIDSVHFTKLATQSGLKYLAKSRTGDASGGSGGSGGWTAHPFTPLDAAPLPDGSVVLALAVTSNDTLFVGGRMTASATMTHLIKYAPGSSVSGWMALSNGGLNDQVTHLATLGTLVIAGGAFTATGDGVTVLRRLAVYDSVADTWASVGFGLSRPPLSLTADTAGRLLRIGVAADTRVYMSADDRDGVAPASTSGVLIYSIESRQWIPESDGISGQLDLSAAVMVAGSPVNVIAGNITSLSSGGGGPQLASFGPAGLAGFPSLPASVRVHDLVWDTDRKTAFLAVSAIVNGTVSADTTLATINEAGGAYTDTGIRITGGMVTGLTLSRQTGKVIVAGSFTSVQSGTNAAQPSTGMAFISLQSLTVTPVRDVAGPTSSTGPTIKRVHQLDSGRTVVLGDLSVSAAGCTGICLWDSSQQSWDGKPFVGIRGDFQGIETTTTGVTYVGGRFTVDAVPAPVSLLSLTGPSSSAAFKPVMLGPATPLTINGRILAMRTSLNGSLYIVSVRDMDAMVILSAYDGALYSTVPLGTRAVITDMTPMRWMSSNSSRGQIDGMLLVGRLPLTSTPDAVMYAAVLFDPADGTLAPYAVSTAGGLVTRVRVAGGIPMRVLQHDGEGPAGLPGWAIALIVIACIVSAVVIGWMIYVIITGETSRQSRAAAHDSRDSLGSFSEKPPTSRRGSRLHPSPLTMPSPLTSPASPTSPMHYSGIKHSSFTWSAPDLKAHHAAHSPSTPTSATHLAHSSFDDITVIDPIHRPPRPPVIGYQEYQQRLHSHSRQQQQQQDLEDDIADAVSNNVNANANINANANTNANHDHDDDGDDDVNGLLTDDVSKYFVMQDYLRQSTAAPALPAIPPQTTAASGGANGDGSGDSRRQVSSWLHGTRETVLARDSYIAQDGTELTFHGGDRIEVLDSTDPYWWTGRIVGKPTHVGLFPASFTALSKRDSR